MNAVLAWCLSMSAGGGTVTYTTTGEGYLDVGKEQGISVGDSLKVVRRKKQVATCEVTEVSVAGARCKSDRLLPGDRVVFTATAAPLEKPAPVPKDIRAGPRADLLSEEEMEAQRKLVLAVPVTQRKYKKTGVAALPIRGNTLLRQQVWATSASPTGIFSRSSIDMGVRAGIDAGFAPLVISGSARVTGDLIAPENQRFRTGELVELYLFSAAASIEHGPVVGSLGRFRPRLAPGVTLVDGVQVGTRLFDGSTEIGAYAGAVPDLINLLPSLNRLVAGSYFGLDLEAAQGIVILPRARVGVASTSDFSVFRGELEVQTELFWARVLNLGGSLRAGMGATEDNLPSLDAARADFSLTVIEPLRVNVGYRFRNKPAIDFDAGATALGAPPLGAAHQLGAHASYALAEMLGVGLTAGAGYDVDADLARGWIGPELMLPTALGPWGGMTFGYIEELGALPGRSAWVQARVDVSGVRYMARGSYFEHEALGDPFREAGFMFLADAPLLPWLSLRGRGYVQQSFGHIASVPRPTPTMLFADVGVLGSWP